MPFQIPTSLWLILFGVGCSGFLFLRDNSGKGCLRVKAFRVRQCNELQRTWQAAGYVLTDPVTPSPSAHRFGDHPYPSFLLSSFTFRDPLLDVLPHAEKVLCGELPFQERCYYCLLIWDHLGASVKWSWVLWWCFSHFLSHFIPPTG